MSENKVVELACAKVEKLESDILLIKYKKDYEVEMKDVREVNDVYLKFANGAMIYSIMDSTDQHTYFKKDAQKYLASEAETVKHLIASLIVLNRLPTRILTRFFVNFLNPPYKIKIFKTVEEALDWIKKQKKVNPVKKELTNQD